MQVGDTVVPIGGPFKQHIGKRGKVLQAEHDSCMVLVGAYPAQWYAREELVYPEDAKLILITLGYPYEA